MSRRHNSFTKHIRSACQQIKALLPNTDPRDDPMIKTLMNQRQTYVGEMKKALEIFPIWSEWLKLIPGIGVATITPFILHFNYKFVKECKKCGGDMILPNNNDVENNTGKGEKYTCKSCGFKGSPKKLTDGLPYKVKKRNFDTISKWWVYTGVAPDKETGHRPQLKKGDKTSWSPHLRTTAYLIGENFNKNNSLYKDWIIERKRKREKTHPDLCPKGRQYMCQAEGVKLFLSHFWHVQRRLNGESVYGPYAQEVMNHTGIIDPYYWLYEKEFIKKEKGFIKPKKVRRKTIKKFNY